MNDPEQALPYQAALTLLLDPQAGPLRRTLAALRLIELERPLPDEAIEALLAQTRGAEVHLAFCFCEDCMRAGGLPAYLPFALARGPRQVALAEEALRGRAPEERAELVIYAYTYDPGLDPSLRAWLYEGWLERDRHALPEARGREVAEASAEEPRSVDFLCEYFAKSIDINKHDCFELMPLYPALERALSTPELRAEAVEALAFPLEATLEALGPLGLGRRVRRAALEASWDRRCPLEPREERRRRELRLIRGLHLLLAWGPPGQACARAIAEGCRLHPDIREALELAALGKKWRP